MNRDDLANYIALALCEGIGPVSFQRIVSTCAGDSQRLFKLTPAVIEACGLNQAQVKSLANPPWEEVEKTLAWAESAANFHIIVRNSPQYPELLNQVSDAPSLLFAIGRIELLHSPQIAMVGSRNCTPGGAQTAHEFAAYLEQAGLTVTSGLALGIDSHAHKGALQGSGNTIAVTGTGIDRVYPSRNKQLAHEIAEKALIISEFPLGTSPVAANFPRRNRIISGLSLGTLVVEATRNSGSLITARLSLEQGREVFAIPGSIHNPQAKGCHQLIRDGAKLVDQASDIIDDIGSLLGFVAEHTTDQSPAVKDQQLGPEYLQLLDTMGYDPVSIDTLVARSGLTIEQLSSMLLILELNDQIQPATGGYYVRC